MKILFIIESLRSGGKERRLTSLVNNLTTRNNIKMEMILFSDQIHYEIPDSKNFKIHIIVKRSNIDIQSFFKVCKICKKFNPDIINPWGNLPAFYSIFLKFLFRIPIINNQITDGAGIYKSNISNLNFFFSNKVVSNSKAGLESYNISKEKGKVIYNGFDFSRLNNCIKPEILIEKYSLSDKIIIGMVASFSVYKDYKTFLKSAEIILNNYNNIKFFCVGDGNKTKYLTYVKKKFRHNIIFLDKQNDVESLINIFDIGVLSTYTEGISNVLMEYMAHSKPVVATNGGGTFELVENKKSGFLVDQQNPIQMAKYLEVLINNPDMRIKMGKRGLEIIKNKFSYKKMCDSFFNTYKAYTN